VSGLRDLTQEAIQVNGVELAYLSGGEATAPLVICLHGFPDSALTFKHLAPDLIGGGFRVAVPWLRGYPPSEVVQGPYQMAAVAHDVIALADELSPGRSAYLVGHDWGGLATYGATALAPDRWERAVVLSVAPARSFRPFLIRDWDQQRASWYQFLFQLEPLAERVVQKADFAFIERLWEDWSPGWAIDREILDAAKKSIAEGFPAALTFYRHAWQVGLQDPALAEDQQRVMDGPVDVPTLVLRGEDDGCILAGAFDAVADYFSGEHAVEVLPRVGHFLHLEDPEGVNRRIIEFLREQA
jgi:pimeloyl-ACP methyl ester carboxylesterase